MTHTSTDDTTYRHAVPQAPPDQPRTRPLAAAALRAAAAGWAVFPVRPRGKTPAVRSWEHVATLDPDRILAWWADAAWNIGVAVGRCGLLVVDLDVPATAPGPHTAAGDTATDAAGGCPFRDTGHHLADGADPVGVAEAVTGSAVLRRLAADAAVAPPWDTFTVATPSGGRHLYFRQPDGAELRNTQGALGRRVIWSRSSIPLVRGLFGCEACEAGVVSRGRREVADGEDRERAVVTAGWSGGGGLW